MDKEPTDVGDDTQVKKRKTKAQLRREHEQEELRQLLSTPGGRYFLWRLLDYCKLFHTISSNNSIDMALLSGRRDAGLWVFAEIMETAPNTWTIMKEEANQREEK
jgi:hypothetical protein|tara:strand:- start:9004 stop:9318 length:315 start_codon:yes stop_codon:yes gene_type:complete